MGSQSDSSGVWNCCFDVTWHYTSVIKTFCCQCVSLHSTLCVIRVLVLPQHLRFIDVIWFCCWSMLLSKLLVDLCSKLLIVFGLSRWVLILSVMGFRRLLSGWPNMRTKSAVLLRYRLVPLLGYRHTIWGCLLTCRENWLLSLLAHALLLLLLVLLLSAWNFHLSERSRMLSM